MKLLVLHSELGVLRGGGENFSRHVFSALARRGHQVSVAFVADRRGRYPVPLPPELEPLPVSGIWASDFGQSTLALAGRYLPGNGALRTTWDRVQEGLAWRAFAWHKRRFQQRIEQKFGKRWHEFDATYVHGDVILAREVARHCLTILRLPGPVAVECGDMLRDIHVVVANGDALRRTRTIVGHHALELPVGLDIHSFAPASSPVRARLGWRQTDRVVGYVGRLTHLKGVDLLAAAFREVAHDMKDLRLLVIGTGDQARQLHAMLSRECARGQAHIEPAIGHEQLPAWYQALDLIVMPSRYENHSNALLEAMACGVPFLASDVGGNRTLSDTGAGWLFTPGSPSALSTRLRTILSDAPALRARGQVARQALARHHGWDETAARLESIILGRLQPRGAAPAASSTQLLANPVAGGCRE